MEALANSSEVQAAKTVRKAAKCALTRVANTLKKSLILETGKKYDFLSLDKYSVEADATKLEKNSNALNESNEHYANVAREFLIKNKAADSVLNELDDLVDKYWTEARKEATEILNLYKFEYSTALECYLKNINEENKPVVSNQELSAVDSQKAKKKTERDSSV